MIRFRLSRQAIADLDEIWDYIGRVKSRPAAASRQVEAIHKKLTLLSKQPLMGHARDDLRPNLRCSVVGNYVIFYYPLEEGIEVARVLHGAQDIEGLFQGGKG